MDPVRGSSATDRSAVFSATGAASLPLASYAARAMKLKIVIEAGEDSGFVAHVPALKGARALGSALGGGRPAYHRAPAAGTRSSRGPDPRARRNGGLALHGELSTFIRALTDLAAALGG
jgi:hypothetical protein